MTLSYFADGILVDVRNKLNIFYLENSEEYGVDLSAAAKFCGVDEIKIKVLLDALDKGQFPTHKLQHLSDGKWRLAKGFDIVNKEALSSLLIYFAYTEFNAKSYMIAENISLTGMYKAFSKAFKNPFDKSAVKLMTIEEAEAATARQKIAALHKTDKSNVTTLKKRKYKKGENPEHCIQVKMQKQLGGQTEVTTPAGRIDLLTETELIEIKNTKDWKGGIGQLLSYQTYYPSHKKRLHLFGQCTNLSEIKAICLSLNIEVTVELDA